MDARLRKQLTQDALVASAEISRGVVQSAEKGQKIRVESLKKIAEALGIEDYEVLIAPGIATPGSISDAEVLEVQRSYRSTLTHILYRYYRFQDESSASLPQEVPVLCPSSYLLDTPKPLTGGGGGLSLHWNRHAPKGEEGANDFASIVKSKASRLYDGFIYRLLGTDGGANFDFCPGRYFEFLNTCEYLGFEATSAILGMRGTRDLLRKRSAEGYDDIARALVTDQRLMPLRRRSGPFDYRKRHTAFGTSTLVILRTPKKKPRFLLNRRSPQLAETPGLLHVIPAATFQCTEPQDDYHEREFCFIENIVREFAEEILGVKDAESQGIHFDPTSPLTDRGKRFRELIRDRDISELLYLGMVVDPFNLKPEIITVLIFHEAYLEALGDFKLSWETDGRLERHEFTREKIQELLHNEGWVPTGRSHLWLVNRHFDFIQAAIDRL